MKYSKIIGRNGVKKVTVRWYQHSKSDLTGELSQLATRWCLPVFDWGASTTRNGLTLKMAKRGETSGPDWISRCTR